MTTKIRTFAERLVKEFAGSEFETEDVARKMSMDSGRASGFLSQLQIDNKKAYLLEHVDPNRKWALNKVVGIRSWKLSSISAPDSEDDAVQIPDIEPTHDIKVIAEQNGKMVLSINGQVGTWVAI
jgi:hypothetical protein